MATVPIKYSTLPVGGWRWKYGKFSGGSRVPRFNCRGGVLTTESGTVGVVDDDISTLLVDVWMVLNCFVGDMCQIYFLELSSFDAENIDSEHSSGWGRMCRFSMSDIHSFGPPELFPNRKVVGKKVRAEIYSHERYYINISTAMGKNETSLIGSQFRNVRKVNLDSR